MESPPDNRPPMASAMRWVSTATTVSLEMAIPAVVGVFLDKRFDTLPWLTVIGALLGLGTGMTHLLKIAGSPVARQESPTESAADPESDA